MTRGVGGHSPANIQKHLSGVHYPADKEALEEAARSNAAPPEVMEDIQALPDEEYGGPQDVMKAWAQSRGHEEEEEESSTST